MIHATESVQIIIFYYSFIRFYVHLIPGCLLFLLLTAVAVVKEAVLLTSIDSTV